MAGVPPSALYARLAREAFAAPALEGAAEADVVVVGGGIGGLAAALALRRAGLSVLLLEAATIGAGASGRNNGQVIPTLTRHDPEAVLRVMGEGRGERFLAMLQASADLLFETVARYAIDCDAVRTGWIQPAHTPGRARLAERRAAQWARRGAPATYLDAIAMHEHLGSPAYAGGWRHAGGGHINPLAFTRGLARAAQQEGVRIHEHSRALRLAREADGWRVSTPQGAVRCRKVVVVTAAHADSLWPGLARTVVPVTSYQLATEILPPALAARILPGDEAASDTRYDLRYFHKDREGRLISGGALAIQAFARQRLPAVVRARLGAVFPELAAIAFPFFWGGRIAMTTDRLPRLHRTPDGLVGWTGCNGRGLALAMGMGEVMRDAALGVPDEQLALAPTPLAPIPLHGLVRRTARLALLHYRRKDRAEIRL
ncbi:MAG: FAD-binding oxidoreductase [Rhodospirillales bacterium]|nr:FAD-binding oxidoreductase [Rhodospirillales bacterium]